MTTEVQQILTAFDALSPAAKQEAASALLRRISTLVPEEISVDAIHEIADAAFLELDGQETEEADG
jgi:hypothetical protein